MSADAQASAFYEAEAVAYAARSQPAKPKATLISLAGELPPGARVLDLGCGGGQDSAMLREMGFYVTSIDASPGLAAEAARLWDVEVRVLDFAGLDYNSEFDAVLAQASLHHARRDQLPSIFQHIRTALKPSGVLHATFKADPNNRRDRFGRFFCAMDEAFLRALATDWEDVSITSGQGFGYDGEPTQWLALDARRPRLDLART